MLADKITAFHKNHIRCILGTLLRSISNAPRVLLRRAYDWTIKWAETPQSLLGLFLIALAESSFFPIPPDVLLIAIVAARQKVWLKAAGICAAGSLVGAALGYAIGAGFMSTIGQKIISFYNAELHWDEFLVLADIWGVWFLAAASFTPIPFKVATIASGSIGMPFGTFLLVSLLGRASRFFLVASALRFFGARIRQTIEANFDAASLIFFAFLIGGFLVLRLF